MKIGKDYIGIGVGGVILNENNEILLMKRKRSPEKDSWSIPGGKVELMETIEDAVIREVKEELGVKTEIIKLLGIANQILESEKTHWLAPSYLLKIIEGIPQNIEPEKHEEIRWFDLNELPEKLSIPTKRAIEFL